MYERMIAGYTQESNLAARLPQGATSVIQAITGEGLAQGPYVAVRGGFKPTTFRTEGTDNLHLTNHAPVYCFMSYYSRTTNNILFTVALLTYIKQHPKHVMNIHFPKTHNIHIQALSSRFPPDKHGDALC